MLVASITFSVNSDFALPYVEYDSIPTLDSFPTNCSKQAFYELRKAKGMTEEEAKETLKEPIYFGTMMVKQGDADGLVSGAAHIKSNFISQ